MWYALAWLVIIACTAVLVYFCIEVFVMHHPTCDPGHTHFVAKICVKDK
jgi:hypothetical protein